MARTRTTWTKGQGGKPKGAKDEVPRSFKASIRAVFEEIQTTEPQLVADAILRGLTHRDPKKAFPYVRLAAELQGELKQIIQVQDVPAFRLVLDDDDNP